MAKSAKPLPLAKIALRIVVIVVLLGGLGWGGNWVWKKVSPGLFGEKRGEIIPTAKVKAANISEEIVSVGRVRAACGRLLR